MHPERCCWIELDTTNQAGAKDLYSSLFGWSPVDSPMGPDAFYTIFKLNGRQAAAAFAMNVEEQRTVPVHWHPYLAVESADAAAIRAKELGGKVIEGPYDVQTFGWMAPLQDPAGAFFSVRQSKDHIGMTVAHENCSFCWADLSTPDPARAKQFYEGLFGWKIGPAPNYPPGVHGDSTERTADSGNWSGCAAQSAGCATLDAVLPGVGCRWNCGEGEGVG